MKISSPAFSHNSPIPPKYTCDGEDISPPLSIVGVPHGTKSLALIVEDPDAVSGTFDHWVVYNIPVSLKSIEEGREPDGVPALNGAKRSGYTGPCPPRGTGTHHYLFKIYALDRIIDARFFTIPTKNDLMPFVESNTIASSEFVGLYSRDK